MSNNTWTHFAKLNDITCRTLPATLSKASAPFHISIVHKLAPYIDFKQ